MSTPVVASPPVTAVVEPTVMISIKMVRIESAMSGPLAAAYLVESLIRRQAWITEWQSERTRPER
jgi:hypothetical protein